MTELWACTDCPAEVDFEERREHMATEHGVNYSIPEPTQQWQCSLCWGMVDEAALCDHQHEHLRVRREHRVRDCPDCTDTASCERAKALEERGV